MSKRSDLIDRYIPGAAKVRLGLKLQALFEAYNARGAMRSLVATYSFASQGGAVGSIVLAGPKLPAGAIVLGGLVKVTTALNGGAGATAALQAEAADDLIAATIFSGAPWSTVGRKSIIPVFTGATSVETTVERAPTLVVAVNPLTAGKFSAHVVYLDTAAAALATLDDIP
jgi:hypothetical protein